MNSSFDLPDVDQFRCGTVGPPGQRVFYLQMVAAGHVVSLQIEKQQVALLADYLERVLASEEIAASAPAEFGPLIEPVTAEWVVGSMMVAVNEASGKVVVIAEELTDEPSTGAESDDVPAIESASARIALTRSQIEAFIEGSREIIGAGRPICRLCGRPIDPDGHACPRMN